MPPPRVSFLTKGESTPHNSSYIITNRCYVQYIAPHPCSPIDSPPILFIHGGGLTGSQWEATPDRRPGWAILAASKGRHVYIMDGVDSGRSQRAPDHLRSGEPEWRDAKQMWERFRFGPVEAWEEKKGYEDSAFNVAYLDQLVAMQTVRRRTTAAVEIRGFREVLAELAVDGPVDVVAHSHGAALLVKASNQVRELLCKVVLVEPGSTSDARELAESLKPLVVWGDHIKENKIWHPLMRMFDGAEVECIVLKDVGLVGNSHFPMSDSNSSEVWEKISDWISS